MESACFFQISQSVGKYLQRDGSVRMHGSNSLSLISLFSDI